MTLIYHKICLFIEEALIKNRDMSATHTCFYSFFNEILKFNIWWGYNGVTEIAKVKLSTRLPKIKK